MFACGEIIRPNRRSFRLGVCSEREAADIADKIDRLIRLSHQPNLIGSDALAWAGQLADKPYQQLVDAGVLPPREAPDAPTAEAAMAVATKAGNLDEAVAIREKIAALKAEEEAGQIDPRVATIVGTWKEPNGTPWTFTADGKWVATKYNVYGTWTLTATSLRVVFGNNNIGKNRVDVYTDFTDGTISGKSSVGHEMRLIKDTAKQ